METCLPLALWLQASSELGPHFCSWLDFAGRSARATLEPFHTSLRNKLASRGEAADNSPPLAQTPDNDNPGTDHGQKLGTTTGKNCRLRVSCSVDTRRSRHNLHRWLAASDWREEAGAYLTEV